ncbi:MAG: RNA polymerase sigma factor region1.1 domain-containing protein, partial [Proteobacteria bacterium]|nr:RNA polymerase sigma factor region1.1 domain-containing protein [Pseudomonadota bacterium]
MTAKKSAAPAKAAKAAKPAKAEVEDKRKSKAAAAEAAEKPAKAAKAAPAKAAKPAAKAEAPAKGKPGRKPKDEKAKKEEVEEDFSDIDAELEGEPEVEVADDGGSKAEKAKPLRMKVSRAKERALMREFGLDETQLTEEEVTKRRQELKTLIKMGKTRGFLTHQEINDHLPEKLVDNEIL